ncbi:MAG: hypothetical protein AAGD96_25115 [Chloroflexota bacterium]
MPEIIAISVVLFAVLGELFHHRRIHKIKALAFGPKSRPAAWSYAASILRVLALGIACWGFASLWLVVEAEIHNKEKIEENEYKHLVLVVDVSPSMHLKDAGPERDKTIEAAVLLQNNLN